MTLNHKMIWNEVKDYLFIALGLAIYTIAFTVFLMPYQIVAGGVTGLSAIIYYATGFHLEKRRPKVQHVHAEARHELRDRAAAALLGLAQLRHLPDDLADIHHAANFRDELRAAVGRAALRGAARVLGRAWSLVEARQIGRAHV